MRTASSSTRAHNRKGNPPKQEESNPHAPAFLFDLDGTLVDSAYEHVLAWAEALRSEKIYIPHWMIHRRIGMSGRLLVRVLLRELNRKASEMQMDRLEQRHSSNFRKQIPHIPILPGARDLLRHLSRIGVQWAIATSGNPKEIRPFLKQLDVPANTPVVTGEDADRAKPAPDLFMVAAQRLGVSVSDSIVIGDSAWDLLAAVRKKGLGVGLLSGGYSREELEGAGAYRIFHHPADLLMHIEDLGIQAKT